MTIKANIAQRHERIDVSLLPQTLQDALFATRKLGLEYIWIDSICILQDDRDDWAKEASTMADVYSNGYAVLAATAASSSTQGFLWPRKPPLSIACTSPSGSQSTIHARRNDTHWCNLKRHNTEYPLYSRAWCMQERYLARRTVHFLPAEVRFECRTHDTCECNVVPWPHPQPDSGDDYYRILRAACESSSGSSISDAEFAGLWNNLVKEYSAMGITHRSDLLPALGGIARSLGPVIAPGLYLAGLWERGLAFQLSWYCEDFDTHLSPIASRSVHTPTWSWISSPSHIEPVNRYNAPKEKLTSLASLVSSNVALLRNDDPYGEVKSISIDLKGPMASGPDVIKVFENVATERNLFLDLNIDVKKIFRAARMRPETWEQLRGLTDWEAVICLALYTYKMRYQGRDRGQMDGLLLQRSPGDDSMYVRIGIVTLMPWELFEKVAAEAVVTIV
ncbi:hypothetical protein NX059_004228 [Plenodomus lindquistii]|nr:hypothetical protein NX059_004228 [Plenodomus lindquistii]